MAKQIIAILLIGLLAQVVHAQEYAADSQILKIYDVRSDLTITADRMEITKKADIIEITKNLNNEISSVENSKDSLAQSYAQAILDFSSPHFDLEKHQLEVIGDGALIVRATKKHHEWISSFLTVQRSAENVRFLIEMKWYSGNYEVCKLVREKFEQQRSKDKKGNRGEAANDSTEAINGSYGEQDSNQGLGQIVLTGDVELEALLTSLIKQDKSAECLHAPSVLVQNRKQASVSAKLGKSYITGYEVHENVEPAKRTIVVPVITKIDEGWRLVLKATLLQNNMIGLDIRAKHKKIVDIKEILTDHGPISLLDVSRHGMTSRFIIAENQLVMYSMNMPAQRTDKSIPEDQGKGAIQFLKVTKITGNTIENNLDKLVK